VTSRDAKWLIAVAVGSFAIFLARRWLSGRRQDMSHTSVFVMASCGVYSSARTAYHLFAHPDLKLELDGWLIVILGIACVAWVSVSEAVRLWRI
jgi:predicted transporter